MKVDFNIANNNVKCRTVDKNSPNFSGNIIYKGFTWHEELAQAIGQHRRYFTPLLKGHDVIVREVNYAPKNDSNVEGRLLNVLVSRVEENSRTERLLDTLGLVPRYKLAENDFTPNEIKNAFNIESFAKLYLKFKRYFNC